MTDTTLFDTCESQVRTYCRSFPTVFTKADGHLVYDQAGRHYIDFLMGAGSLNYGHNDPDLIEEIVSYLKSGGILQSLDLHTAAKADFIEQFYGLILTPRSMDYHVQFTGPTGTDAVEAALKLARKVTQRTNVIAFTNGFHGMTLGALSATGNTNARAGSGTPLAGITTMPYDGYLGPNVCTLEYIERMLAPGSGIDQPAAFILEVVQAEGGLNSASPHWLIGLQQLARDHGALVIVDDIQAGCGRTGSFFSFEGTGLDPDIILLSKSLSGVGTPLAIALIRPELDIWAPGQHTGTFRGNNLAFVAGAAALRNYWGDGDLGAVVDAHSAVVRQSLDELRTAFPADTARVKGRGLLIGLEIDQDGLACDVSGAAFGEGLIIETCGARNQVLKLLPPLNISDADLRLGLQLLRRAVEKTMARAAVA